MTASVGPGREPRRPQRRRRSLPRGVVVAGAVGVFVLFAGNLVDHLVAKTLCCADDALFAVSAKNLAEGAGYAASYLPEQDGSTALRPFAPAVAIGPVLVAPVALGIRIFGHRYWVPGAVTLTLVLVQLVAVFGHFAAVARSPERWAPAVVVGIAALNLVTIGYYEQWYAMLGEIPALLWLCLGALRGVSPDGRWPSRLWAGFFLGLAFQTKTVAAIASLAALAAIGLEATRDGVRRGIVVALLAGAGFCMPTAAFESAKVAALGWDGYRQLKAKEAQFLESTGQSGIAVLLDAEVGERVRATAATNGRRLSAHFGTGWTAGAFLVALGLVLGALRRWSGGDSAAPLVLAAMAVAHSAWWLLLSDQGRIRHLLTGLGLGCLAIVFDLFCDRWSRRKAALAVAFAVALVPRAGHLDRIEPPRPFFRPSPRVVAMLAARDYLEAHRAGRVVAADWWASGCDMEYLLDGSVNLVHHRALGRLGPRSILFYENAKWIDWTAGGRERWQASLERYGASLVFAEDAYRIYAGDAAEPASPGAPPQ